MNIITLDEIKAHCRIDITAEDSLLEMYGDSAEEMVLSIIDRPLDEIYSEYGVVPTPIKHACLMLVSHFYEQRSPVSTISLASVPYTVDALLKPYWKL